MDKKQKKSLRRHLLVIYIFYFLALAAGFIHSFVPHVSSSLATGWQAASEDIRMQENTVSRNTPTFGGPVAKRPERRNSFPIETGHASISTEAEYTGVNIYVKTDENSDPTVVRTLNRINYILLLSIPALLAKLSILILVALIINILRKSVRDEQPLPGRIIIYTRAVGFLLILAEVCTGVGSYIYQSTTRTFLEDSPLQVAASFPLNYWNIVMAILVLFSAEVFSIGSRLSEEQKLTI